ncbi:putative receptor-like protein kinase At2g23200 [Bidens hawaiensis]|uniref:putative receptor-like protein kinase At2g23200 n=1 Tax=Bidens hawaiensis TaxID=980011 RepID=UPI00404A8982
MSSSEGEYFDPKTSLDPELAPLRIRHEDILDATNNFAEENLLKQGEKADAYKGLLSRSDVQIHVVIWKYSSASLTFDFYEVVKRISRLKHRYFVSFVGFSDEKSDRMIVMEHVVDRILQKDPIDPTFTWSQRLNIFFDAALALNKVHDAIRSFKILLDTEESDVYYFGLILLEMLYGRKPTIKDVNRYLAKRHFEEEEQLDDIVPPDIRTQMHTKSLSIFSEIAYNCLKKQPDQQSPYMFKHFVRRLKEAFDIQWKHENYVSVLN